MGIRGVRPVGLGHVLKMTIFGESHGACVGVVVEGVPPGLRVDPGELNAELARRRPGAAYTSPRREADEAFIASGVYKGYTTGAPVTVIIWNRDVDSSFYEKTVRFKPRPGHADAAALMAYMGFHDYRGGGFHSGRLTAGMVAAGYFARLILRRHGVSVAAYLKRLGGVECRAGRPGREEVYRSPLRCPDKASEEEMAEKLREAASRGWSLGGVVEAYTEGLPPGLGAPHLHGLDADIAAAMFSIPGVVGVEFGEGFRGADASSEELEEAISVKDCRLRIETPWGGVLGGFSVGDIVVRVAFKPTPTVRARRRSIDIRGLVEAPVEGRGRHDPAIAVRGVAVVDAMLAFTLADHLLLWLSRRYGHYHLAERGAPRQPP